MFNKRPTLHFPLLKLKHRLINKRKCHNGQEDGVYGCFYEADLQSSPLLIKIPHLQLHGGRYLQVPVFVYFHGQYYFAYAMSTTVLPESVSVHNFRLQSRTKLYLIHKIINLLCRHIWSLPWSTEFWRYSLFTLRIVKPDWISSLQLTLNCF